MTETKFPKVKSDLQSRLEAEGWEHFCNVDVMHDDLGYKFNPVTRNYEHKGSSTRFEAKPDWEVRLEFAARFADVKVEQAYDIEGKPVQGCRAVYVKRA